MARHAISLIKYLRPAMHSIAWDHILQRANVHSGRPYITVYYNIQEELGLVEGKICKPQDLVPYIALAARDVVRFEATNYKSELYFKTCVLLFIFVNAYLEAHTNTAAALKTVELIGKTEHCPVVETILKGEQID